MEDGEKPIIFGCKSLTGLLLRREFFHECGTVCKRIFHLAESFVGRDLLKEGVRKRVGGGSSVSIYKDHWIPRPTTCKVISPRRREDLVLVSQLKNSFGGMGWSFDP